MNLPYFYDDKMVDYIINAVDLVATHGWKLLPLVINNQLNYFPFISTLPVRVGLLMFSMWTHSLSQIALFKFGMCYLI